jgi:hypothetical protein
MPAKPTATIRGVDGGPLDRDDYAVCLSDHAIPLPPAEWVTVLGEGEALAMAALLDELAGVSPGEQLGMLARELAARIYDRLAN